MAGDARIRIDRMRRIPSHLLPRSLGVRRSDRLQLVVLGFILLVAAAFRLHGLETWDGESHQHPDERFLTIVSSKVTTPESIVDYFNSQRSSLSPYNNSEARYAYGQLPLTLTRVVAEWTGKTSFDTINGVGRALFNQIAERATALDAKTLELSADPNAEGFYQRMGATRIGEVRSEIEGQPRILPRMSFDLQSPSPSGRGARGEGA